VIKVHLIVKQSAKISCKKYAIIAERSTKVGFEGLLFMFACTLLPKMQK